MRRIRFSVSILLVFLYFTGAGADEAKPLIDHVELGSLNYSASADNGSQAWGRLIRTVRELLLTHQHAGQITLVDNAGLEPLQRQQSYLKNWLAREVKDHHIEVKILFKSYSTWGSNSAFNEIERARTIDLANPESQMLNKDLLEWADKSETGLRLITYFGRYSHYNAPDGGHLALLSRTGRLIATFQMTETYRGTDGGRFPDRPHPEIFYIKGKNSLPVSSMRCEQLLKDQLDL